MEKTFIDELNDILYEFVNEEVYCGDRIYTNVFDYTNTLMDLVWHNIPKKFLSINPYQRKMKIEESIQKVREFFEEFNPLYTDFFDIRYQNGNIKFEKLKDAKKTGESCSSFSKFDEFGNRYIKIVYSEDFSDVYAIIHEIFHDTNLPRLREEMTIEERLLIVNRTAFTELVSLLATMAAREYFISKGEKESELYFYEELYGLHVRSNQLNFAINMTNLYIEKGFINDQDLVDLTEGFTEDECDTITDYLVDVIKSHDLLIFFNERYLTAHVITYYLLNNGFDYKKILEELNDMLLTKNMYNTFDYLGLDITCDKEMNITGFSDETLKVLKKSFDMQMKKM